MSELEILIAERADLTRVKEARNASGFDSKREDTLITALNERIADLGLNILHETETLR